MGRPVCATTITVRTQTCSSGVCGSAAGVPVGGSHRLRSYALWYRVWSEQAGWSEPIPVVTGGRTDVLPADVVLGPDGRASVIWFRRGGSLELVRQTTPAGPGRFAAPAEIAVASGQTVDDLAAIANVAGVIHLAWINADGEVHHLVL